MIVAETGLEPQDRDPTPVNSDGEGDASCADSEVDEVPDIVAAPSAGTDPRSEPPGMPKRRRLNDASSAPSGIIRTPAGLPVAAIAVTPGGVAILQSSTLPPVGVSPAVRDDVVSAVRRRGGVVGRRVRRRTGGSSTDGLLSSVEDVAGVPPLLPPASPSSGLVVQAAGSLPADQTARGPPTTRRSTVGLPCDHAPTHVFLRGTAARGSLHERLVAWFRNVRARRDSVSRPPA